MFYKANKETVSLCIKLLNPHSLIHKEFLIAYKNNRKILKITFNLCDKLKKLIILSKTRKLTEQEVSLAVQVETALIKITLPVLKGRYTIDTEDSDENITEDDLTEEPEDNDDYPRSRI